MRSLCLAFLLLAAACTNASSSNPADTRVTPPPPATPGVTGHATLSGTVAFHGVVPAPVRSNKNSFPECARFARDSAGDFSLKLSPQGGVSSAFVWIKQGLPPGSYPIPETPVTLDQKGCEFVPRVIGIRAGQPLELVNSDPMLHNVHAVSGFNVPLPVAGFKTTRKFTQPRVMQQIGCDVHGWMKAYAGVVEHPFFAVTGEDGAYSIPNLPAGTYDAEVWHERLGRSHQSVTLGDAESKKLDFDIKELTPP